eukprot:jgi/Bigna1/71873/fgenesh1_pg.17_\
MHGVAVAVIASPCSNILVKVAIWKAFPDAPATERSPIFIPSAARPKFALITFERWALASVLLRGKSGRGSPDNNIVGQKSASFNRYFLRVSFFLSIFVRSHLLGGVGRRKGYMQGSRRGSDGFLSRPRIAHHGASSSFVSTVAVLIAMSTLGIFYQVNLLGMAPTTRGASPTANTATAVVSPRASTAGGRSRLSERMIAHTYNPNMFNSYNKAVRKSGYEYGPEPGTEQGPPTRPRPPVLTMTLEPPDGGDGDGWGGRKGRRGRGRGRRRGRRGGKFLYFLIAAFVFWVMNEVGSNKHLMMIVKMGEDSQMMTRCAATICWEYHLSPITLGLFNFVWNLVDDALDAGTKLLNNIGRQTHNAPH